MPEGQGALDDLFEPVPEEPAAENGLLRSLAADLGEILRVMDQTDRRFDGAAPARKGRK